MRVGIICLLHESNTFHPTPTGIDLFERDLLVTGEAVRETLAHTHHEVGGFFEGLEKEGVEAVPVFASRTMPSGTITAEAFEELLRRMFDALEEAGPLDGLLLAPHGATVSEKFPDADGEWLSRVRERAGSDMPVVFTIDPHANLTQRMVDAGNATTAYRTNPHVDQKQRGLEAASLMGRTLRGEIYPVQAASFPPVVINIERQLTSAPPCLPLYELADSIRKRPGVLSVSVVLGFPYADVEEMGSSFIVVTDDDPALAESCAKELSDYLVEHREDFRGELISVDEALDMAAGVDGPVGLLDMGDNIGGGSPADGTILVHAILERGLENSLVSLYDPESVEQAVQAGAGSKVRLSMGGKTDSNHGTPLEMEVAVESIHDGKFRETQVRHGGWSEADMGTTVIVRGPNDLLVQLTSNRIAPFSDQQLICCGIHPRELNLIVIKGVHAPVAAYESVCARLIRVNTPGITTADMFALEYRHRRRPMFPFEDDAG